MGERKMEMTPGMVKRMSSGEEEDFEAEAAKFGGAAGIDTKQAQGGGSNAGGAVSGAGTQRNEVAEAKPSIDDAQQSKGISITRKGSKPVVGGSQGGFIRASRMDSDVMMAMSVMA